MKRTLGIWSLVGSAWGLLTGFMPWITWKEAVVYAIIGGVTSYFVTFAILLLMDWKKTAQRTGILWANTVCVQLVIGQVILFFLFSANVGVSNCLLIAGALTAFAGLVITLLEYFIKGGKWQK